MSRLNPKELKKLEERLLQVENKILRNVNAKIEQKSYNQAIDDAADLLNCVDLPRDELAAAVMRLKK